jgi:hypothetical protein
LKDSALERAARSAAALPTPSISKPSKT